MYYILDDDGHPVKISNVLIWASFFQEADRLIAVDIVGDVRISTVFLGMDYLNNVVPLLFETMIFGGDYDGYFKRSPTKKDALIEHENALNLVKNKE